MKNKKLIALLTNHDDDIYCFRKELIESLIEEGYELLISCPYGEKLELMKEVNFKYEDVEIDRRGTNVISDFKLFVHYYKLLKKYKPEVVLAYTAKPNVYGSMAAKLLKIPYINNVTGLGSVIKKDGLLKSLIMFLFKVAFKKSKCIFFQNKENMDLAKKQGLVSGYHQLIPGSGVNTERFPLAPYPVESEKVIFNYIGRVMKDKSIDDYIEAAIRIKEEYNNTEFNIIGFIEPTEMHYAEKLQELENQGIIIYRGSQKDVKPFISRSHCTIHPSSYGEGMSNVLLESASSGRPLITTDIAGCREIVDNNVSGYIYQAGNVEELIKRIKLFLKTDDRALMKMGELGREKVRREFSRDIVINAYSKQIAKCIK
ncbi:glycosyltransferase family 4 protein [Bacillus mycoides]|uniref:glycosyltransferase family 4 protein n=1 Tax=Bacillus mycoides TaxID=1405 RepID=UPI0021127C02|nr:glycosyltransferase family 4 protein [Bacillus mycoides]MCQ6534401.1 glycosyltransferase family 4 protein [Bacillus mycoides]